MMKSERLSKKNFGPWRAQVLRQDIYYLIVPDQCREIYDSKANAARNRPVLESVLSHCNLVNNEHDRATVAPKSTLGQFFVKSQSLER